MTAGQDFARVLAEAGEDPPGPRPAGWVGEAALATMREHLAAAIAARAARHARGAAGRQAARRAWERAHQQAGSTPGPAPAWLCDDLPDFRVIG